MTGVAVALIATLLAGTALASRYLVGTGVVTGRSMEPTLRPGDRLFVDLWSLRHRSPRPGEVVVVDRSGQLRVKRVTVSPEGDDRGVWVLGDRPSLSEDSRHHGPVPAGAVRGRVVGCYWPPARWGPIR